MMHLSADYSKMLSIIDESLTNPLHRLKCMLFAPELSLLPDATVGDVIRFHRLKVSIIALSVYFPLTSASDELAALILCTRGIFVVLFLLNAILQLYSAIRPRFALY